MSEGRRMCATQTNGVPLAAVLWRALQVAEFPIHFHLPAKDVGMEAVGSGAVCNEQVITNLA